MAESIGIVVGEAYMAVAEQAASGTIAVVDTFPVVFEARQHTAPVGMFEAAALQMDGGHEYDR